MNRVKGRIMLLYQLYLLDPASRRFKSFSDNDTLEMIFDYLKEEHTVKRMIEVSLNMRPAMEAVIEELETLIGENFDLEFNYRHRQVLGSMIRYIMGHHGYFPGNPKLLKKGHFVKTAIAYHRGS